MPFDGITSTISKLNRYIDTEADVVVSKTPVALAYINRRPDSIASTIALLRRARDLIADEQRWCKGSFARTWFGIPAPPQSVFAHRVCAIGAIMRAGRELQLRTQDACQALQRQTGGPIEEWNDAPVRTHAEAIAAFDAALAAIEAAV